MIKLSQEIPEVFDPTNLETMRQWMVSVKQSLDELARKAQSLQIEVRTTAPSTNDIEEGEFVRATVGGLNYIYTKKDGVILRFQIT